MVALLELGLAHQGPLDVAPLVPQPPARQRGEPPGHRDVLEAVLLADQLGDEVRRRVRPVRGREPDGGGLDVREHRLGIDLGEERDASDTAMDLERPVVTLFQQLRGGTERGELLVARVPAAASSATASAYGTPRSAPGIAALCRK